MPDLIGQTLGGYRILSQIGKGGMAAVYKAFQPSLERHVAVKVLPSYYAEQDETFLKRFRLEARSVARLRHPNILTIHEYGEENGITFIVMEYVEAGTLTERLGAPMPLPEIEPILRQVAGALSYAHDQGVIHRDVKPSNILLPKPDWPLLTDFGLAKIVGGSHLTQTGSIAGTPAYMSPEQGRGEAVDHLSDIYSLGIVLYEMATGAVPFTAETPMAVIVKHIIEPLPLPRTINPALPESVEAVILKALAKSPADRYARADEMARAFSQSLGGRRAPSAAREARGPSLRRWVLPAALVALLGCAILAGARFALARVRLARGAAATAQAAAKPTPRSTSDAPRTFDQLMADGRAKLDRGEVEAAAADFQSAVALDPANLDVYWEISGLFGDYGYGDIARSFADAALAAGPDEAWFHDSAGWHYYYLGAYADSAAQFQQAIELDPESLWSYIGLSNSLRDAGDLETARAPLDALAAHEPMTDPDLYENLGWGYSSLEAYPEAQAAFRQAVTLDPAKTGAWSGLISAVYSMEGAQAAWDAAEEAVAANPDDPSLHESLGNLAWELGDLAGAEAEFIASTQLDPTYSSGYTSLASLYQDQGRIEDGLAVLQAGLEINPQDPWLHSALGQALIDQGDAQGAFEHFSAAAELDPTYGWFPVQAAAAYYQYSGDASGAAALLEQAAAAQPGDADVLDAIGQQYEAMGDCGTAAGYYARALEINPEIENSQAGLTRCGS